MRAKALSVRQPWANLIANGEKDIETRKWATSYRGELAIVSSKAPNIAPTGCLVAIVTLADCRPMTREDELRARCPLYDGAFAWVFRDIRKTKPIPITGKLGLFDIDLPEEPWPQATLL